MIKQLLIFLVANFILLSCNFLNAKNSRQASINSVMDFSQGAEFISAKSKIQEAAKDGYEHAVAFGRDTDGEIITSAISGGNHYTTAMPDIDNKFADLHNHPDATPPFSGDIYAFIDLATTSKFYQTKYVITSNGTVYALILTDRMAATNFNSTYARVPNPKGFEPTFPEVIIDEINKAKHWHDATEEMAVAFALEKYNAGVALLKQNGKGNFERLAVKESTDTSGNKVYILHDYP